MPFDGQGVSRRGDCETKRSYPSREAAVRAIWLWAGKSGAYAPSFRAYPCRRKQCQAWHIAHRITKGRKGKR